MSGGSSPQLSALAVAAALDAQVQKESGGRERVFPPTVEQAAIIESAPFGRALVVAGAGSGKTETMASRVVWLLANGHVTAAEVLGLTFTRKAAGELATRVRERLGQLARAGVADLDVDPFDSAEVSTYNSFAARIYRENAALIGREPEAIVLGEAAAWQLARGIVAGSRDPRLAALGKSVDQITEAVIALSRSLSDNVATSGPVHDMVAEFAHMHDLPIGGSGRKKTPYDSFVRALGVVDALPPLLELADTYALEKRRRGLVEFSDQLALALQICIERPEIVADYRARFPVVLLDEYQDTSVVQTTLLATLFGGHGVMAVGDPDQSIYGWRGASAANLARFPHDFAPDGDTAIFDLSMSWRNPRTVLAAANALVEPFTVDAAIPKRALKAAAHRGEGAVSIVFEQTVEAEADAVAGWLAERLSGSDAAGVPRTAALLCRSLKRIGPFLEALDAHGVPYHVLGLAGLLDQAGVVDLVCALRVMHDPSAGSELIRLLTGPRWLIGALDIAALHALARWLLDRDHTQSVLGSEVKSALRESLDGDENASLVDALDFLTTARPDHRALVGFSETGYARMRAAGLQLTALRRRGGLELLDLITLVQQELLLDIEVAANDQQPLGRASLDAFSDLVTNFVATSEHATLGGFLSWLHEAEKRDKLAPRQEKPEPGTVQVLTIHGSKGLEWDLVAVPRLVADELPGKPLSQLGWLALGELPFEFKGDCSELPELAWRGVHDQFEFDEAVTDFKSQIAQHYAGEQRRLAYVALTRAASELLLSGSWWSTQVKPRGPSAYLREIVAAGIGGDIDLPAAPVDAENPRVGALEQRPWPLDPLGRRRGAVEAAAAAVREAQHRHAGGDGADALPMSARLRTDIEALLRERERRANDGELVALPTRIPASAFKDYIDRPAEVAANMRRPMPQKPYRATRLGTLFHSWVEKRSIATGIELLDASGDELDESIEGVEKVDFARLRATFEASEWASREPSEVEIEIHLVLAEQVFICKLDAVYELPGEGGARYQIVDWKTGRAPKSERDLELKQTQLALYRLAFAQWKQIEPSRIDAVFYFVADDEVVRPKHLYSEAEVLELWAAVSSSSEANAAATSEAFAVGS